MFNEYIPSCPLENVSYLKNEQGIDWYQFIPTLAPDSVKLQVNELGRIVAFDTDASMLYPKGCDIVEVMAVPADLSADGTWLYEAGSILKYPPSLAEQWSSYQADAKSALEETGSSIERIIEAVALGKTTLTAADVVAFMKYRASLRAILNEAQPTTIPTELPTKPDYPANT